MTDASEQFNPFSSEAMADMVKAADTRKTRFPDNAEDMTIEEPRQPMTLTPLSQAMVMAEVKSFPRKPFYTNEYQEYKDRMAKTHG